MASGRFDLTKTLGTSAYIYSRCEWSSSGNVSNNKSTIYVNVIVGKKSGSNTPTTCTFNTSVSVSGANSPSTQSSSPYTSVSANQEINVFSGSFTIDHNADGTKSTSISVSIGNNNVYHATGSSNITLDTIPRASSLSGGSGDIGGNSTITITRASSSFTHKLIYEFGNLTDTIASNVGTSYTWKIPTSFYSQIPNANVGTGTITCITYSGSTEIGRKSISFTARVTNSNPSTFDFIYADIGGMTPNGNITYNLTGNDKKIIKGYSSLFVMITNEATAQNGAYISYYQIENQKINVGVINPIQFQIDNYSKNTISVIVVDSRGNSTTITKNIDEFIEYQELVKENITLSRSDNGVGEFVNLKFSGVFWNNSFGSINNDLSIVYKYKKTNEETYNIGETTIIPLLNDNYFEFDNLISGDTDDKGFDVNSSYDLLVEVTDKINKIIFSSIIGTGSPAIAIYKNKVSIGKKYDESLGGTQLWGDIYVNKKSMLDLIYPIGAIYLSTNSLDPNSLFGGIWEQIKDKFLLACGDKYENGSSGGESAHVLTIDEMPNHGHSFSGVNDGASVNSSIGSYPARIYQDKAPNWTGYFINNNGGGKEHNNMPPYLSVYVWVRVS